MQQLKMCPTFSVKKRELEQAMDGVRSGLWS